MSKKKDEEELENEGVGENERLDEPEEVTDTEMN